MKYWIEYEGSCGYDNLEIVGISSLYCGHSNGLETLDFTLGATINTFTVRFTSDYDVIDYGFIIEYSAA